MEYINPVSEKVQEYAKKIDQITDGVIKEDILQVLSDARDIAETENKISLAYLYYCVGNIYSIFNTETCSTEEEAREKALHNYRKSIKTLEQEQEMCDSECYKPYIKPFKGLLYTNYANELDRCGRKIAAIEVYQKAIEAYPSLGMALGNLGSAYQHYALLEYDKEHSNYLHYFAYHYLKQGANSDDPNTTSEAKKAFQDLLKIYPHEYIETVLEPELITPNVIHENLEEQRYREWCLSHKLFLNTLNDLPIFENYFAADTLQLPSILSDQYSTPVFHGMFSSLKQEFIYARYLLYEASSPVETPLFSDCKTYIKTNADGSIYSIRLEKLKSSFKTLYGLFDKIAYFMAHYFNMGFQNQRDISFRNIWKKKIGVGKNTYTLTTALDHDHNFSISSLYWLSKDYSFTKMVESSPNPELKRIISIRNYLEHRYVKIYDDRICFNKIYLKDELAEYISEEELFQFTETLLKTMREALINLAFCVNKTEELKMKKYEDAIVGKIPLIEYDDQWKL